jgi:predicted dehydrogenase
MQVQPGNIRTQQARGGGPLLDLGIYCVNAARSLFRAEPTEVCAFGARRAGDRRFREIDEQVTAILRFPDDRVAQFVCSFGAYDHSALTVVGEKGRITMDPCYEYAGGLTVRTEVEGRKPREKTFPKRDQIAAELEAFARYLRQDQVPEPSGEEGLADMRVLDAITRSQWSGRVEKVGGPARPKRRAARSQNIKRPPHPMPDLVDVSPPGQG